MGITAVSQIVVGANTQKFSSTATLKSKVLPIQLAQDTVGFQECYLQQIVTCILNSFQLLQSVGQVSRRTSKKYELIQDKLGAFSRTCNEGSVWCQTSTRVPIKSNFYNTCPTDMKLNQSRLDMSLPIVIQFGGNPGCNKKILSISPFWDFRH